MAGDVRGDHVRDAGGRTKLGHYYSIQKHYMVLYLVLGTVAIKSIIIFHHKDPSWWFFISFFVEIIIRDKRSFK